MKTNFKSKKSVVCGSDVKSKYRLSTKLERRDLWSVVLTALLIGSLTISGCGKTAGQSGAGGGSESGSSGDIITFSGSVELNATDAQQLGISTQSITTRSIGTLSLVKANGNGKVYLYRPKINSTKSSSGSGSSTVGTQAENSSDENSLNFDYEKVTDSTGNPIMAEIKNDGTYDLSCPNEKIKDLSQAVVTCEITSGDKMVVQSSLVSIPKQEELKQTKKIEAKIDPITTYVLASFETTLISQLGSLFSSLGEAGLLLDSTKELVTKIVLLVMETINTELAKADGSLKAENLSMIANKSEIKDNYVRPRGKIEDKIQEITENEKFNNLAAVYGDKAKKEFKTTIVADEKKFTEYRKKYKDFDYEEFQKFDTIKNKEMFRASGGGTAIQIKEAFFADMSASDQYQVTFKEFYAKVVENPYLDTVNNKQTKYSFDLSEREMLTHLNNMIITAAGKMVKDDWASLASVEMGVVPLIDDPSNPPTLKAEETYNIDRLIMLSGAMNGIQNAAYVEKKKTISPSLMYYDPQKLASAIGVAGISSMPPPTGTISNMPGMDMPSQITGMPGDGSTTTPSPSMPTIPSMPPVMNYASNDYISYSYINFQKYYSQMTNTLPAPSAGTGSSMTAAPGGATSTPITSTPIASTPITPTPPTTGSGSSTPSYTPPTASTPPTSGTTPSMPPTTTYTTPPTSGTSGSGSSSSMDMYGSGTSMPPTATYTTPPTGFSYATTSPPYSYSYAPPTTSYYDYSGATGGTGSMYMPMTPQSFSAYQEPTGEMVISAEANVNIANASEKTVKVELQEDGTAIAELEERNWDTFYKTLNTQSTYTATSSKTYILDPYSGGKKITPKIGKVYKLVVIITDAKGNKTNLTGEEKKAFFVDREFLPQIDVQYNKNTGKLKIKVSDRNDMITNLLKEAKLTDGVAHWRATVYDITAGRTIFDNWSNWEKKNLFLLGSEKELTVKGASENTNITLTVEISTINDGYISNSIYTTQGFTDSINNHAVQN